MISYSAECETTGAWLSIEILVDGVALSPTAGTSDAFCSGAGHPELGQLDDSGGLRHRHAQSGEWRPHASG